MVGTPWSYIHLWRCSLGTSGTWHRSLSSACHISRFCCSWCLLVSSRTWNTSPLQLTVAPHVSLISTKLTRINVVMTQFIATYEGFENPAMRATTQPVRGELLRRDLNQTVAEVKTSKKGKPERNKNSKKSFKNQLSFQNPSNAEGWMKLWQVQCFVWPLFGMSLLVEAVYAIVLCFATLQFPGRHNTLQAFDGNLPRSPPWSLCPYDSVEEVTMRGMFRCMYTTSQLLSGIEVLICGRRRMVYCSLSCYS